MEFEIVEFNLFNSISFFCDVDGFFFFFFQDNWANEYTYRFSLVSFSLLQDFSLYAYAVAAIIGGVLMSWYSELIRAILPTVLDHK